MKALTHMTGFANIPDYVRFIESLLAEARGELPFPILRETPEFQSFVEAMQGDEPPSEEKNMR